MRIFSLLTESHIFFDLKPAEKSLVLEAFVQGLKKRDLILNDRLILKELLKRETLGSTGLEKGIAIPHALTNEIKETFLALAVIKEGVDFDAADQMPTYILMLLLGNEHEPGIQLKVLAHICRLVKETDFVRKVLKTKTPREVCAVLEEEEEKIV